MTTLTTLPAVETPTLLLCEIELYHAPALVRFMTQPRYQRHTAVRLKSEAEVSAFVARSVARRSDERRNIFHLAAEERASGEAIGDGFLIVQSDRSVEVGWGVHPAMWSCGLGTEIGQALLGLAFERLRADKIWCKVMAPNKASGKLAVRLGMTLENTVRGFPVSEGRAEDVHIYGMTAQDYFEQSY
jgi:RimJ/RimL family protein N-acetyltransferase